MIKAGNWQLVSSIVTRVFYDVHSSLVLSRLMALQDMFEGRMFYQTYEQLSFTLHIKPYTVSKSVKDIISKGLIKTKRIGNPSKVYYYFNAECYELIDLEMKKAHEAILLDKKKNTASNKYNLLSIEDSQSLAIEKTYTLAIEENDLLAINKTNVLATKETNEHIVDINKVDNKESKSKEVNNTLLPVFFKNDHASEIDSLKIQIEELKSLIEQKNKVEAEVAKCNNIANNELAVLSASIGTSYVSTQESKDKPVKARKNANSANITIEQDANFASFEVFAEKWDKVLAAKYPKLDASLVYEWFVPAVQAKYNGTYKDHFAALRTWLGRSSDAELSKLSKFNPTEQYNNEGLINGIIERTKGQPTTMDKIDAKAKEVWEKYMNDQNNK